MDNKKIEQELDNIINQRLIELKENAITAIIHKINLINVDDFELSIYTNHKRFNECYYDLDSSFNNGFTAKITSSEKDVDLKNSNEFKELFKFGFKYLGANFYLEIEFQENSTYNANEFLNNLTNSFFTNNEKKLLSEKKIFKNIVKKLSDYENIEKYKFLNKSTPNEKTEEEIIKEASQAFEALTDNLKQQTKSNKKINKI